MRSSPQWKQQLHYPQDVDDIIQKVLETTYFINNTAGYENFPQAGIIMTYFWISINLCNQYVQTCNEEPCILKVWKGFIDCGKFLLTNFPWFRSIIEFCQINITGIFPSRYLTRLWTEFGHEFWYDQFVPKFFSLSFLSYPIEFLKKSFIDTGVIFF